MFPAISNYNSIDFNINLIIRSNELKISNFVLKFIISNCFTVTPHFCHLVKKILTAWKFLSQTIRNSSLLLSSNNVNITSIQTNAKV